MYDSKLAPADKAAALMAMGDETIVDEEFSYAQPVTVGKSSPWKVWGGILVALILVSLAYSIPVLQQQHQLNKMRVEGASLDAIPKKIYLLSDLADFVEMYTAWNIPQLLEVYSADLSNYPTDDGTLQQISRWPKLSELLVQNAAITDQGLYSLVSQSSSLGTLFVINCPYVTSRGIDELQALKPGMQIRYRGTAFLGIHGIDHTDGCIVLRVVVNSPADKAGVAETDIIHEIDGVPVTTFEQLVRELSEHQPGDEVALKMKDRHQDPKNVTVTLGNWPE